MTGSFVSKTIMMDPRNKPANQEQDQSAQQPSTHKAINPFENKQPVEDDITQSKEELDNEQQYKEALTERD